MASHVKGVARQRKGQTSSHPGGTFVLSWDRLNLGSGPWTGKKGLFIPGLRCCCGTGSCVCLSKAVGTHVNTSWTWEARRMGPWPVEDVT
jgi:hypothetical protein